MMHSEVKENDALILHHPDIGYVWAWAGEDKKEFEGSAYFNVAINSKNLPGISSATINVNPWDVYKADDPEVLGAIALTFIRKDWER